jgi:hypothetical protein
MFRWAAFTIFPAALLLLLPLATTCLFLVLNDVPASPANHLAKHVAAVLNFKMAPRLQPQPAERPDFPLFQFYSIPLSSTNRKLLGLRGTVGMPASLCLRANIRWLRGFRYDSGYALIAKIYGLSRCADNSPIHLFTHLPPCIWR